MNSLSWEETVIQGIRDREGITNILSSAGAAAPVRVREILEHVSDTTDFDKKYVETLEREGGQVLVLLYYYWLSLCGESYLVFPLEMQRSILENGVETSLTASEIASRLHETKIEAGFLFRAGIALYDLRRFTKAENTFKKALILYKKLERTNSNTHFDTAKVLNNLGNLYCTIEKLPKAEKAYTEALTRYKELAKKSDMYGLDVAMTQHNMGNLYRHMGKFSEAEEVYKEALEKFKELAGENHNEYTTNVVVTLNNLGILYWSTGKFAEAEEAYIKALNTLELFVQENPDTYNAYLAMTLSNVGNLYSDTGNFKKAEEVYEKALAVRRRLASQNPDTYNFELAMMLSNLGVFYSDISALKKAEEMCLEALEIIEELPVEDFNAYRSCKANSFNNLATVYWNTNNFLQAEEMYTRALVIYRQLEEENPGAYTPDVAMTLNNLGAFYRDTNKFSEAEKVYTEACDIYMDLEKDNPGVYTPDRAMTLNNLGTVYWSTNDFPQAEKVYKKALKLYKKLAGEYPHVYTPPLARTLDNLGSLYQHTHVYSRAEEMFLETLTEFRKLAEETPDVYTRDVAQTLNNLGVLYWSTNDFSQAEKAYSEALTITQQMAEENFDAYTPDVAMILTNLGVLYSEAQDFHKAEDAYTQALVLYRGLLSKSDAYTQDVAMTLNNLGVLYQNTEKMEKAEETLTEALEKYRNLAEENPDAYDRYVVTALNSLGVFYRCTRNNRKAEVLLKEALRRAEKRALWFELAGVYDSLDDKKEEAVRVLELGILFYGEEKYTYAQKGRREDFYRKLLDGVSDPGKGAGILEALRDPDLLSLEWDEKKIRNAGGNRNIQKNLVKTHLKKEIPPRIPHVQMLDNVLFLYIQEMKNSILYLTVTKEGINLYKGSSEFARLGRKLLTNLRVQALGEARRKDIRDIITRFDMLTAQWTSMLPSPILDLLSAKGNIIFSPDSVFSYLPLEGLIVGGEPICLSKTVIRATSMHQLQEITSGTLTADSSLVIGNPWPAVNEDYLIYRYPSRIEISYLQKAEKEAEILGENLPNPKILLNTEATANTFLKELSNHSIIHFAGHGHVGRVLFFSGPMAKFPPEFEPEEFSELRKAWRFSHDKAVYMMDEWDIVTDQDILKTPLQEGSFVFLSACETGQHTYAGGGHFQGLAQAFLRSGASNVVSSLFPLYGTPAKDFAVSFYKDLFSGYQVINALQNTRKEIKEKYTAPLYWLPYIHYGTINFE